MPVLVMGVVAFVIFGVIGIMLTLAMVAEHHKKNADQTSAHWWLAHKRK